MILGDKNVIAVFFAGCSAVTDDGNTRRLRVLKLIIELIQTLSLSTEITTEVMCLLLNEVFVFTLYFG